MRPLSFYAVFTDGQVSEIVEGAATARRVNGNRAYRRFASRLAAEEFAAWWNYEQDKKSRLRETTTHAFPSSQAASRPSTTPPFPSQELGDWLMQLATQAAFRAIAPYRRTPS